MTKDELISYLRRHAGGYSVPGVDNHNLAKWLEAAPAAPAPQLPPMPEPHWPRYYQGSVPPGAYTADQMKAYARAAIEAAIKKEQA